MIQSNISAYLENAHGFCNTSFQLDVRSPIKARGFVIGIRRVKYHKIKRLVSKGQGMSIGNQIGGYFYLEVGAYPKFRAPPKRMQYPLWIPIEPQ